jgi:hypothetical protein
MSKDTEAYESYDGFLRGAIRAYWESSGRSKVNFLSLLLATRSAWQVAWDKVAATGGKKILTGAAGAAAIALILRLVVGGPIGLLLTGASIASLVAIYVKNHERIWKRVALYKTLVDDYRPRYDEIVKDYGSGKVREDQRNLMVDGLMARFLIDLDADTEADEEEGDEEEAEEDRGFGAHVAKKRAEEEEAREPHDGADREGDEDEPS